MSGVYFQLPHPGTNVASNNTNHLQKPPTSSGPPGTANSLLPSPRKELNTPQKLALRVRHTASKLDTGVAGGVQGSDYVHATAPLDYSFYSIGSFKDLDLGWDHEPREHVKKVSRTADGRFESTALKFNNNLVQEWSGFDSLVSMLLVNPAELSWVDISFNYIMHIDEVLLEYPNIKILYLHGNAIEKLSEVDKLATLKNLRSLTLHGNPVEVEEDGYRQYVMAKLPQLRTLDFTGVTKSDRQMAPKLVERNGYGGQQGAKKKHNRTLTESN